MAQFEDNPRHKKRFTFFSKTHSEARQAGQHSQGSFASLRRKAKGLFARHAGPSQLHPPSLADVRHESPQLMVLEEVAEELQNTNSNHPSISLEVPHSDGNRDVSERSCQHLALTRLISMQGPTSDQHAQRQSDKLPTTDRSTHEGQIAHGAESNDSATRATDKPDLGEANEARRDAREAVSGLKSVSGPVQAVASSINVAGDPVTASAVDNFTPLLGTISKFNSIVDTIAEVWNFIRQ
ncbi:hypothetical protein BDR03DRAFT_143348 [Suillus americanus]|nr:hypothetical protein BDR03DRAFT_143348 [Suillus americanus]